MAGSCEIERNSIGRNILMDTNKHHVVTKEVLQLKEVGNSSFDDELNSRIESYEENGWELVDLQLTSDFDPEQKETYSTAMLVFEK